MTKEKYPGATPGKGTDRSPNQRSIQLEAAGTSPLAGWEGLQLGKRMITSPYLIRVCAPELRLSPNVRDLVW